MADRLVQRLIAAGATPDRARAFAQRVTNKPSAALPEKKGDPGDGVYDERIAALSRQLYPMTFVPPVAGAEGFDDYYDYLVRQGRVKAIAPLDPVKLAEEALIKFAPVYANALKGTDLEKAIANSYKAGNSIEQIRTKVTELYSLRPELFDTLPKLALLKPQDKLAQAQGIVDDIGRDFAGAVTQVQNYVDTSLAKNLTARQNELNKNRDYKYGLPDRTLKYGPETNLKEGIVSFRTVPGVQDFYQQQNELFRQNAPGASQAGGIAVDFVQKQLANQAKKAGMMPTPYLDEGQRRFNIKMGRIR